MTAPITNKLMKQVFSSSREVEQAGFEAVPLRKRQKLVTDEHSLSHAYFVQDGAIAEVREPGSTRKVGDLIGCFGVLGSQIALSTHVGPISAYVIVPGEALAIEAGRLRSLLAEDGELGKLVLRYVHAKMLALLYSSTCDAIHSPEQRMRRWLAIAHHLTDASDLYLSDRELADLVGLTKPQFQRAMTTLCEEGSLRREPGVFSIADRAQLSERACPCHALIISEYLKVFE